MMDIQSVPPGIQEVPPGIQEVPPGIQEVPPGIQEVPPGIQKVPPELTVEGDEGGKLECEFCYKSFVCKQSLMRHMPTCQGITHPLMCPKCRKVCTSKAAKSRHVRNCDGTGNEQALVIHTPPSSQVQPIETTNNLTTNNYVHAAQVTMNQQTNNNVVNIHINGFTKEDLSHVLDPEYLDARLCELNGRGVYNMVRDVHFNPAKPENQNIRLGGKKNKTLRVLEEEDKDWHIRANCDVIDMLISRYKSILTKRSFEPDFKDKYDNDFMQIQQDLIRFDKKMNATAYYACAHKILALILDMEARLA
jgi:hypothetical protein